jgi:hypothetical protein
MFFVYYWHVAEYTGFMGTSTDFMLNQYDVRIYGNDNATIYKSADGAKHFAWSRTL